MHGQAGFRHGYRTEDNLTVLQVLCYLAQLERAPLYVVFVDLTKAYDSVDRTTLFEAMVYELGVALGTVAILHRMYLDV